MIEDIIRETIKESIKEINNVPLFMNKKDIAKFIGVSVNFIDRLIASDVLKKDIHYRQLTPDGNIMFYVEAIRDVLRPRGYNAHFSSRGKETNIP